MPPVDVTSRLRLKCATAPEWCAVASADPIAVLLDHAHCEMKAATSSLMLASRYADRPHLADAMLKLARQEITHYESVVEALRVRGLAPTPHGADPYARALRDLVRKSEPHRLLDLLLISAIVEARSCERFLLLGGAEVPDDLKNLWLEFAECEWGHFALFLSLAATVGNEQSVETRLLELLEAEAAIVRQQVPAPRVHG